MDTREFMIIDHDFVRRNYDESRERLKLILKNNGISYNAAEEILKIHSETNDLRNIMSDYCFFEKLNKETMLKMSSDTALVIVFDGSQVEQE